MSVWSWRWLASCCAASLVIVGAAFAQQVPGVKEELRCAAGFGCTGLSSTPEEARSALGLASAEAARDDYAASYPEAYVEDAFSDEAPAKQQPDHVESQDWDTESSQTVDLDAIEHKPQETVDNQDLLRCAAGFGCEGLDVDAGDAKVLAGVNNVSEARDLYAQDYPEAYANDAYGSEGDKGNPVDLDALEHTPQETVDNQDMLRCAAGFGCEGLAVDSDSAKVLLGLSSQADAAEAYEQAYPDAYGRDTNPAEGDPDNPIELFDEEGLADSDGEEIDLFDDGGGKEPIDLSTIDGDKPIDLFGEDEAKESGPAPAYTQWEGYSETPCPGRLFEAPLFMPGIAMSTCLAGNSNAAECGLPAANLFCLAAAKSIGALCYGVTTASRAMSAGTYCEGGACQAFSYIVCK
ncbi:MAG: hypothetical protein Rhirs2KO_29890 [Rhizobiaceae bacterium]